MQTTPKPMWEILPDRLKAAMDKARFNQSQLAEAVGLKQPSIGRILAGETKTSRALYESARVLQTTPEFLTGEGGGDDRQAGLGQRLSDRLTTLGMSQSELARLVGVSQATIAGLITGRSAGSKHLYEIARALQTTPSYLTGETDDPGEGYVPTPSTETVAEQLGLVPVREIDLTFGMGASYLDVPVTEKMRHFSREWIKQYTHADPEHLLFAQGAGDSMFPTLLDSDLMLIDCSQQTLNMADKIWVAAYAGSGTIKRLRQMPDGSVKILSDNPSVPDEIAYDGELHVLGRVVAIIRKI